MYIYIYIDIHTYTHSTLAVHEVHCVGYGASSDE